MRHAPIRLALCCLLLVPSTAFATWTHDPNTNFEVAPTGAYRGYPVMATDGAGGCFVAWHDARLGSSNLDIYVQHYLANGDGAPGWPGLGLPVCTAAGNQAYPSIASDGAGGCWVAWEDARTNPGDRDIYLTHVLGNGTLSPAFPANGLDLGTTGYDEASVHLAADGQGGVYAVWTLVYGASDYDVYGAHFDASNVRNFSGVIDASYNLQQNPSIAANPDGSAWVAYENNDYGNVVGAEQVRYRKIVANGVTVAGPNAIASPVPEQNPLQLVPDATGGAYVVYSTNNAGIDQLWAARILATGALGWFGGTQPVASLLSSVEMITYPSACSDGAGGLVVYWTDFRAGNNVSNSYAARFLSTGYRPAGWPATGLAVCTNGSSIAYGAVPDGTGGAVLAWIDTRTTSGEFYASRLTGAGARPAGWNATGNPLGTACASPQALALLGDGKGGAQAVMNMYRSFAGQLYAQAIDGFGQLGDMTPALAHPQDVPADQGGKVRLGWAASWLDQPASLSIAQYWIWRQAPLAAAQAAIRGGTAIWATTPDDPGTQAALAGGQRLFRPADGANATYAWEYVAALGADGSAQYSFIAPTTTDSMSGHNPKTVFMVEAHGIWAGSFWQSAPDSGYSVDNLPPLPPAPFAGTYTSGSASLHWAPNLEPDLAGYRLYRGTSTAFVPGPGNLVAARSDTAYVDPAGAPYVYKLSAVDVHGNESGFTTLVPAGEAGVGPGAALELALSPPMPNPVRGAGALAFTLTRDGAARLALFDAAGRRVRVLADGAFAAGEHRVAFHLRDEAGRPLADGLYWARLEAEGRALTRRVLALR